MKIPPDENAGVFEKLRWIREVCAQANKIETMSLELAERTEHSVATARVVLNQWYEDKRTHLEDSLRKKELALRRKWRKSEQELLERNEEFRQELSSKIEHRERTLADLLTEKEAQYRKVAETLLREKSEGFPWLATAWADFLKLQDLKAADFLETKAHPARRAAEQVRLHALARRESEKRYRIARYLLEYYETLFPWLIDFRGEDIDDLIIRYTKEQEASEEDASDPVKTWLTPAEYENLSETQRNQLALERYWNKKKRPWEIGRDYERYIGYLYESQGYSVHYQGIVEGLEDLGRDLIAKKDDTTDIVQCKCWSRQKQIHEKHIMMLFGTAVKYWLEQRKDSFTTTLSSLRNADSWGLITPTFITSTSLSDTAREFARVLGVNIREDLQLQCYPSIKCNVSRRNGAKIYHLPMDQQYDRTLIEEERLEKYVETVDEAVNLGFRRAWRWHGKVDAS